MDAEAFRRHGKEMIDLVADYWESLDTDQMKPLPDVKPGFLRELIPEEPPEEAEEWKQILKDVEPVVLRGNTHWHHPNFYAYYPTACSYAGVVGDILSTGIAAVGFTWRSSPSMTELEMAMTDWMAKAIGLPKQFWNSEPGPGIGMIQSTASDATLVALLTARARAVTKLTATQSKQATAAVAATHLQPQQKNRGMFSQWVSILREPFTKAFARLNGVNDALKHSLKFTGVILDNPKEMATANTNTNVRNEAVVGELTTFKAHDSVHFGKLVAYCSDQAHSSVDKGVMLSGAKIRKLPTCKDNNKLGNFMLKPEVLEKAIKEDRANGLIPFILIATVGTTNTCAVESIRELGPICNREGLWLHVDAAYAGQFSFCTTFFFEANEFLSVEGSFLLCEEFRYLADGVEFADSFNFNAHKAMMINFDCSPMWFKNGAEAVAYFNVDPTYLKHEYQSVAADYRHLQVALGRRFRALKIWFVFRAIGIKHIKQYLQKHVELAKLFAELLLQDERFELFVPQHLGLVCFRLKATNERNEALCTAINDDGRIHLVASKTHDTYFLRFVVCSSKTTQKDVESAAKLIKEIATQIMANK